MALGPFVSQGHVLPTHLPMHAHCYSVGRPANLLGSQSAANLESTSIMIHQWPLTEQEKPDATGATS